MKSDSFAEQGMIKVDCTYLTQIFEFSIEIVLCQYFVFK